MRAFNYFALVTSALMASCGGGDSTLSCDPSAVQPAQVAASTKLVPAGSEEQFMSTVKTYLRQVAVQQCQSANGGATIGPPLDGRASGGASGPPGVDAAPATENFSGTNVQEAGVDEADLVKFDGKYLYVASAPGYGGGNAVPPSAIAGKEITSAAPHIRILDVSASPPQATPVGEIVPTGADQQFSGLYLGDGQNQPAKQLVVLSQSYGSIQPLPASLAPAAATNTTQLEVFDVSNPSSPASRFQLAIEGDYISSRVVAGNLYLITQKWNYLPLQPVPLDGNLLSQTLTNIENLQSTDLLPRATVNGALTPLISAQDCLIPETGAGRVVNGPLVAIVQINLNSLTVSSGICTFANDQGIYASTDSIVFLGSRYDAGAGDIITINPSAFTQLHSISIKNGAMSYAASGEVPGLLGWRQPSFRLSESGGTLRIVTTEQGVHQLFTLQAENGVLVVKGQLPNTSHPDPIGKPGEDIYAVRYFGDRAYVVTFQQTDPLYVIDVKDAANPLIAGQLEVPGFSSYLHPLSANLLIGIGKDAVTTDRVTIPAGVKIGLFDVTDPTKPALVKDIILGGQGSDTPVIFDHHALSIVADAQQARFTVPATIWSNTGSWQYTGLHMFDIDLSTPNLVATGTIKVEQASGAQNYPNYHSLQRSVILDNSVHYVIDEAVWSSNWDSGNNPVGPQ